MQKKPIIQFENFTFQYDAQVAPTLKNIELAIYPGEKILIVGASGSGKSTLGKCLNGLIPCYDQGSWQGDVAVRQQKLGTASLYELSLVIGTVLQDTDAQFVGLTVAEDLAFTLENENVGQVEMKKAVSSWAKKVGVFELLAEKPQQLSGGQKQRVAMAGVLIDEPAILLFDEPLASLDPKTGKEAIELIDELHQATGITTIIIEHRLEDVLHCAVDRIIVMAKGEIVTDQVPNDLLRTEILTETGIREPLYLTALKTVGIDLATVPNIQTIGELNSTAIANALERWQKTTMLKATTTLGEPLLELQQLSFSYPTSQRHVLNELELTIRQGEMISIVGPNGAGKSTISKLICGFFLPDSGSITWKGASLLTETIRERAAKIGLIMQNPNQMISQNKLFDEVALGLVQRQWEIGAIQEKVEDVLKVCGLYPFRHWPIRALSYGQKKRATIASMLVLDPELLILDEPTAGQDYRHYTALMRFLQQLNGQGKTIVMMTHDMHLMQEYTKRTIVIENGQVIADGTPARILTDASLMLKASLKETSLYTLAKQANLADPVDFVEKFIQQERGGGPNE